MSQPKILVTGGSGQVGTGLAQAATKFGLPLYLPGSDTLDLTNTRSIRAAVAAEPWSAIINCAAYTAVDRAESEPDLAHAINATAPGIFAEEAAKRDIPILHVSTDYVFDGTKASPYVETDPVAPLGVYGASKEAGEQAVRTAGGRHIILRTAWVFSPWGNNFVKTMLRLGKDRPELGVVADQHGCPTSAIDIAESLLALTQHLLKDPSTPYGTYHFVNAGEASWHEFAEAIFDRAALKGHPRPHVHPIGTADYPTPAKRPANSRLVTDKIAQDHTISPRPWADALDDVIASLLNS